MNNRLVARIGNSESGYSFAFAMGVILIFLVLGAALLTLVVNESTMVVRHYDSRRAYYLAEAGINEALFELNRSPAGDGVTSGTLTVGGQTGSYSTAYSQNTLTATATFPSSGGVTKTISVKVDPAAVSGSWSDMAAIAAEEIENIPAKMTIWNGSGDTDPDRLSLYSNEGLNINGYVLNYNQPLGGADHLGWAYSGGNLGPGSNVGTHFREASSALGMAFPTFDSSSYDNMIDNVGDTGTELPSTISGTQTYGPGIYYREGNLTISSATIQTDSSVTRDDPVYFVVEGKITVTNSTIGVASPTNLADPSLPPSAANPYGNWIRILVGDEDSRIQGTISNRTYINKEVRIYTRDEETHVRDYVTMDRGGLYFGDRRNKIQARNGTTTWLSQTSGTSNRLYATDFPDSSNGIAVGASGTVKYTSDGGTGWSATSTSISGSLRGVSFPNTGNAWAVGDGGSIWKSSNGGSTWSQQATGGSQLNGVSFADSNYGVAVGDGKTIRYTTNGGSTWQNAASTPGTSPD
ncbi:MAG: WD40/YVTN/BNR-like repeat-containing protein, partial [Terriglobia bacterium]